MLSFSNEVDPFFSAAHIYFSNSFTVASSPSPPAFEDKSDDGSGNEDANEDDGASSPSDDEMST